MHCIDFDGTKLDLYFSYKMAIFIFVKDSFDIQQKPTLNLTKMFSREVRIVNRSSSVDKLSHNYPLVNLGVYVRALIS